MEEGLVQVGGIVVERDALRIAEQIQQYDSNLVLQYLEQADSLDQPPFRVMERCRDGQMRVAFTAWQLDERLLERIRQADTVRYDVEGVIDAKNAEARANSVRRYEERILEAKEIAQAIVDSPKDTYSATIDGEKKIFKA